MPAWLLWTSLALCSWGIWAVLSRLLGDTLSGGQSQALSTLGLLPILALLTWSARRSWTSASRLGLVCAILGGGVTCLGNVAYYDALGRGARVAALVSLTSLYPVVTVLLAVLALRERLNRIQVAGLVPLVAALWLFNARDDGTRLSGTVAFAALPIALWGISGFLQKLATNHLAAELAALACLGAFVPVGLACALREPPPFHLAPREWVLVVALGFFLGFGNLAVLVAFARGGKAAVIAPLGSLYPLISVPLAVLVLHERITSRETAAILCALASVVALAWSAEPAAAPAAPPPRPSS